MEESCAFDCVSSLGVAAKCCEETRVKEVCVADEECCGQVKECAECCRIFSEGNVYMCCG